MTTTPKAAEHALEPSRAEMQAMLDEVVERVLEHITSLPTQPAHGTDGAAEWARSLRESMPEDGAPLDRLLDLLFHDAVPRSFNTAGPGYLAYIPGGGLFDAALAGLVADSVNRYVGVFAAAPALSQLEANVVAWFAGVVGYPEAARGFLTSGGSLANLTGIITARLERLPADFLTGTLYVSDQCHHSVAKAARLAGFPDDAVRVVPTDAQFRLAVPALRESIAADRGRGRTPFLVVASAGTTNTGAVDPLDAIADACADEGVWLHVDAAYGGFFAMTERGHETLRGLSRADSLVLDPHKGLFLPYGSGCLLVRDGEALRRAHTVRADYMPPMQDDDELVDFCEISPELSRGFRGLKVWLPMKLRGAAAFRRALDEKLDLARWITDQLRAIPDVEIVAEPQLSIVAFRLAPREVDGARLDRINQRWMARINGRKRVYLTGTRLECGFVIRICVLSFRTHQERMRMAVDDIQAALADERAAWPE